MSLDVWDGTEEGGQQEERRIKGLREKGEAGDSGRQRAVPAKLEQSCLRTGRESLGYSSGNVEPLNICE